MQRIPTRLGDGSLAEMTRAELEADLHAGVDVAVRRAKVDPLTDDEIARVHSPIGLDIGAETPAELAVSIVAELIQVRAGGAA